MSHPTSAGYTEWLPTADVSSRHEIEIHGGAAEVYAALLSIDLGRSPVIRLLFWLRGISRKMLTLSGIRQRGFTPLSQVENSSLVLGIVGRFWSPSGRLRRLEPEEFRRFEEPGCAKAVWGFVIEEIGHGRVRLVTETHVRCFGRLAGRRFGRYWYVVGPFSGLIRREMLRLVRQIVEQTGAPRSATRR